MKKSEVKLFETMKKMSRANIRAYAVSEERLTVYVSEGHASVMLEVPYEEELFKEVQNLGFAAGLENSIFSIYQENVSKQTTDYNPRELKEALEYTILAMPKKRNRPEFEKICVDGDMVVGTDAYRLHVYKMSNVPGSSESPIFINKPVAKLMIKILRMSKNLSINSVSMSKFVFNDSDWGGAIARFSCADGVAVTVAGLCKTSYPNWHKVFEEQLAEPKHARAKGDGKKLEKSIKSIKKASADRLTLRIDNGGIRLEHEGFQEDVPAKTEGGEYAADFNTGYLMDLIHGMKTPEISAFNWKTPLLVCEGRFYGLLMPMLD